MPLQEKTKKQIEKKPTKANSVSKVAQDYLDYFWSFSKDATSRKYIIFELERKVKGGQINNNDALEILKYILKKERSKKVKTEIIKLLGMFKEKEAVKLLLNQTPFDKDLVFDTLSKIGTDEAYEAFMSLDDPNSYSKPYYYYFSLPNFKTDKAKKQFLEDISRETDKEKVKAAIRSVSKNFPELALEILKRTKRYDMQDTILKTDIAKLLNTKGYEKLVKECVLYNPELFELYEGNELDDVKEIRINELSEKIKAYQEGWSKDERADLYSVRKQIREITSILLEFPDIVLFVSADMPSSAQSTRQKELNSKYVQTMTPVVHDILSKVQYLKRDKYFLYELSEFIISLPASADIIAEISKKDKDAKILNNLMNYMNDTVGAMDNPLEKIFELKNKYEKESILIPVARMINSFLIQNVSTNVNKKDKTAYTAQQRREALQKLFGKNGNGIGLAFGQLCADYRLEKEYPQNSELRAFANYVRKAIIFSSPILDTMTKLNKESFENYGRKYDGSKFYYLDTGINFYGHMKAISDFIDETAEKQNIGEEKKENIITNLMYYTSKNIEFLNYSGSVTRMKVNDIIRQLGFTKKDMDRFIRSTLNFGQVYAELKK